MTILSRFLKAFTGREDTVADCIAGFETTKNRLFDVMEAQYVKIDKARDAELQTRDEYDDAVRVAKAAVVAASERVGDAELAAISIEDKAHTEIERAGRIIHNIQMMVG